VASIENRSHFLVTVKNRDDLTKTFPHNRSKVAEAYSRSLESQKLKPKLVRMDDQYAIRDRSISRAGQTLTAKSKAEAELIKSQLENEQKRHIFIDYAQGYKTTFADLLIRYLREEAPRVKSFEVIGYKINAMLEDAGLERQDLAQIVAAHPNPHARVKEMSFRKPTGQRMRKASGDAIKFIRRPFAELLPVDIIRYKDARCMVVKPATVDREIDIFSAVCTTAIDTWRIHINKSPMIGVKRPPYFNERDRRLRSGEEERLLSAAYAEDRANAIELRLEQLMSAERIAANEAKTVYRRKQIVKEARQRCAKEAELTYEHIPLIETLVQFQIMTAARRSEALALTWRDLDLDAQTAFIKESKNGRPRKLPIRQDLVVLLQKLPRENERVFPINVDGLNGAWSRICKIAGFTGNNELHLHDLRHEGISRVAEAGSRIPGGISLVDLQAFSGHRDVRMLLRYAHLCTQSLAQRLDKAFRSEKTSVTHHGRKRLTPEAKLPLKSIIDGTIPDQPDESPERTSEGQAAPETAISPTAEVISVGSEAPELTTPLPKNVINVDFKRRAA
jgi:integrase